MTTVLDEINNSLSESAARRTSGYQILGDVLQRAWEQAAKGKGHERHNSERVNFSQQPIAWIEDHFHSWNLGQAVKKLHESQSLPLDMALAELLGAINYIAAHYIHRTKNEKKRGKEDDMSPKIEG